MSNELSHLPCLLSHHLEMNPNNIYYAIFGY